MAFDENAGTNKLANVLAKRMKKENESPLTLDFGVILANGGLQTNTFPVVIPKGDYTVCRHLALGKTGAQLTSTKTDGKHEHDEGGHEGHTHGDGTHTHDGGIHKHSVLVPEKMRSLAAGDRVLVAWVQNEAVVVDIIVSS